MQLVEAIWGDFWRLICFRLHAARWFYNILEPAVSDFTIKLRVATESATIFYLKQDGFYIILAFLLFSVLLNSIFNVRQLLRFPARLFTEWIIHVVLSSLSLRVIVTIDYSISYLNTSS